jgi:AcrR family transcriptional regulator
MSDEQILEMAARLWLQFPGDDFTMERLVEATGISRATLYRRFGSREALLQRLAADHALEVQEVPDIPTRIVEATRVVLNRSGYSGVTMEQIAQEAGVGAATVYRHFGNKETLLDAFMRANSPRTVLRNLIADEESDLEADLVMLGSAMLEFIQENFGLIRVFIFEGQADEPAVAKIRASQGRTVNMLAEYLAYHMHMGRLKPGDPFELALSFVGIILGLGVVGSYAYERPLADIRVSAYSATQLFLQGVAKPVDHSRSVKMEKQP